jgi:hypothetical protein
MLVGEARADKTRKGPCERTVLVPPDKSLLLPLLTVATFFDDPNAKGPEGDLFNRASDLMGSSEGLTLTVDGQIVPAVERFRVQSDPFGVRRPRQGEPLFPELTVGRRIVSEGYFVILKPLSAGEHVIRFQSEDKLHKRQTDVTYKVTVTAGK